MLSPDALHMRPIAERHRVIFYIGHLEAFDWNMVGVWTFGKPSFNPGFDRLFAFGIDPVNGRLPDDKPADWPALEEIFSYRDKIRAGVDDLVERADITEPSYARIVHVAIEHRLMHAETLAYMLHWLDFDTKRAGAAALPTPAGTGNGIGQARSATIPEGETTLGLKDGSGFGWDNEFQSHSLHVAEFSMDIYNVTNAEFLEFVQAGGYEDAALWTAGAWDWLQQSGTSHPKFWIRRNDAWFYRTMFAELPLPPAWPVYVSHAEASAYARWKHKSLPTEAQYHRAAFGSPGGGRGQVLYDGNFDLRSWTPMDVGSFRPSAFGVFDLVGNGWEWTSTPFAPFEGFEPFSFYPGYSTDFFDGKHFVLKGASPRTSAALVRSSFRNWFQPYYPNIYASFRCVEQ
jgi:ergothioneine biosynthesis protein EgtB